MGDISRRAVLGTCGTALTLGAGCLGDSTGSGNEPNSTDDGGSWESFRAGPSNAGIVETAAPRDEPAERWRIDLSPGPGTAAVSDGTAFLAAESALHALEVESGEELWTVEFETERTGSPAVTDDAVVCPVGDGLVAVDRDGAEKRRIPFDSGETNASLLSQQQARPGPSSSPTVVDGTVYVGTPDGDLVAVSLADESVTWRSAATAGWTTFSQAQQSEAVVSSPAVVDGRVIVGTEAGVAAFDAADGSSEWTYGTERAVRSSPAVADGTVYVGGSTPIAISMESGDLEWQSNDAFETMSGRQTRPWVDAANRQERTGMKPSVAVGEDIVVGHDPDDRLVALERSDGSTRWEAPLEGVESIAAATADSTAAMGAGSSARVEPMTTQLAPSWSSPAITGDVVVVGTTQGIVAVSVTDGEGLWRIPTESRVVASPAVADGTVVVGDDSGACYALDES
ncbi:outer membrane protein assembly factor BamB family protein [Natrinema versiforme]|uniref:PQQ enzyme repeat domain protein n=1 Tax=Natrinema versiforme JCM 10478 TaxID=1227496 RepID=L9Y3Y5_9EURY|nr:PQQ-binding-like beta-propeller repeat protein [Natrinema versiforme]ELY68770.1 PQQ enzyme repeat domain protein [Natrinema versiforme JCM 10478]